MPSNSELAHLIALVFFGALALLVHCVLVRRAFGDVEGALRRALLFVPFATPVLAYRAGHVKVSMLWCGVVLAYLALLAFAL